MADEQMVALSPGQHVSKRWTIVKKLSAGEFGAVYLCKDSNGMEAALKTEPMGVQYPLLAMEVDICVF